MRVLGKGNKLREVPIKGGTLEAIRAWLTQRGSEPGPLVCPVGKAGRVEPRRLAPQAILRVCEKRGGEAGLAGFAAHDLRRTYISALLYQGVDLLFGAFFGDGHQERIGQIIVPVCQRHAG